MSDSIHRPRDGKSNVNLKTALVSINLLFKSLVEKKENKNDICKRDSATELRKTDVKTGVTVRLARRIKEKQVKDILMKVEWHS